MSSVMSLPQRQDGSMDRIDAGGSAGSTGEKHDEGEKRTDSGAAELREVEDGTQVPSTSMDSHPNGGLQAWMQVAASSAMYFNHLGLLNSFGVFQTYYESHILTSSSPSDISWIGSVQVFCLMTISVIIGPLYDAGYCRGLIAVGTAMITAGFMLTSVSTQYWHILLAQGICIGLGMCCLSVPSIAIVPMYFKKRRALAMALSTVGSGLGATLYPLIFEHIEMELGFGWAVRIMGFICLAMGTFAFIVIRPRTSPEMVRAWKQNGLSPKWFIDREALKEKKYLLYCAGQFFNNLAFFEQSFYLQTFALVHGMQHRQELAHYLLAIMNASSIPGRIIPSFVADKVGCQDTYVVICAFSCASVFYWISVSNTAGNISFATLWGFFSGGMISLAPVVLTSITPDMKRLGTRIGMVSILKGIGSLVGPPIAGAILDATHDYLGIQLFSGTSLMLTAVFAAALRIVVARATLRQSSADNVSKGERDNVAVSGSYSKEETPSRQQK